MNKEYQLQVYVMRYLRGEVVVGRNKIKNSIPFPEIKKAWHVYQGRSEKEGFFLKELGVSAGIHDVHLIWKNNFATIELKAGKNKQSVYQRDFTSKMEECGHKTGEARSVEQVRDLLISWGLECKNPNCIEPPLSELEKREIVYNMYAPRN